MSALSETPKRGVHVYKHEKVEVGFVPITHLIPIHLAYSIKKMEKMGKQKLEEQEIKQIRTPTHPPTHSRNEPCHKSNRSREQKR